MHARLFPSFVIAALVAVALLTAARADDSVSTVKFSDPGKPGGLKVSLGRGNVRITGSDSPGITVKSSAPPVTRAIRKDGLRVLSSASGFSLTEKDNVVILDALSEGGVGPGTAADFTLTVPRNTRVTVQSAWGGDVTCTDLTGDVEIKNMSGDIRLNAMRGGILVETMNGGIRASILELREGRPLSFTSMNGEVVLRIPADAKANVRLRTQNGSVLTDFDERALVTKTETTARTTSRRVVTATRTPKPAKSPTAPAVPAAPTPATAPKPPADSELDADTRAEIRESVREGIRAGAEAAREAMAIAREAVHAAHEGLAEAGIHLTMPPIPPLPPISGGKLVTGTLNGGGPEISVATLNGDVTLRQLEQP